MIDEYLLEIFQTEEDKFASSGAEGAIFCIDNDKKTISFSGAKRPLWIQDKNGNVSEIKSQRRILGQVPKIDTWEEKEISIEKTRTFPSDIISLCLLKTSPKIVKSYW